MGVSSRDISYGLVSVYAQSALGAREMLDWLMSLNGSDGVFGRRLMPRLGEQHELSSILHAPLRPP